MTPAGVKTNCPTRAGRFVRGWGVARRYNRPRSKNPRAFSLQGASDRACVSHAITGPSPVVGVNQSSEAWRWAYRSGDGVEWSLRRNCSITPRQVAVLYASLCVVSLGVATFFWRMGATLVLPFAVLELLAVATALVLWARRATDGERIRLDAGRLIVEVESAGRLTRREFVREWVRVQPPQGRDRLIELRSGNQSVSVGRYLRPDLRPALAREIRLALSGA